MGALVDPFVVRIELIDGVEGPCLVLVTDDGIGARVAGPKPWGGGMVKTAFLATISLADLRKAHREEKRRERALAAKGARP